MAMLALFLFTMASTVLDTNSEKTFLIVQLPDDLEANLQGMKLQPLAPTWILNPSSVLRSRVGHKFKLDKHPGLPPPTLFLDFEVLVSNFDF